MFTTPTSRWTALQTRNPLAHSSFVYAVLTTQIYCRPDCISRLARRSNVRFYDTAAEAAAAGYRACKRCRPEMVEFQPQADAVKRACEIIEAEGKGGREIGLQELAGRVGVTKCHLHRVFRRIKGVTPREWGLRCRVAVQAERGGLEGEGDGLRREEPWGMDLGFAAESNLPISFSGAEGVGTTSSGPLTESISPASFLEPETPLDLENTPLTGLDIPDSWASLFPLNLEDWNLDALDTTSLLADLEPATRHAPEILRSQLDLLFTIRLCSVGYLLVAFRALQLCMLRIGRSEDELLLDVFARCAELECGCLDLGEAGELEGGYPRIDEQSKAALLAYVNGVVESLARPVVGLGKSDGAVGGLDGGLLNG